MMTFTEIFIRKPVLSIVVSLVILVLGIRAMLSLPIREFPEIENGVITITTTYTGANPSIIEGFITSPIESSVAQSDGIDYITSFSTASTSVVQCYLDLNYDTQKALTEVSANVNAVLEQLPGNTLPPVITVTSGETINSMYLGFYSNVLTEFQITDYVLREVVPKLQSIQGVQSLEFTGDRFYAMRSWLDPKKLYGYGLNAGDITNALEKNHVLTAVGRTDGSLFTADLSVNTDLKTVKQFQDMSVKANNNAIVHLGDVGEVALGAMDYDTSSSINGKFAVFIGVHLAPAANHLEAMDKINSVYIDIKNHLPEGLYGEIVYDSSDFIHDAFEEVFKAIMIALFIVTIITFLFLGTVRSAIIPIVAIPFSLIGTFFVMFWLEYSINLLTMLAFLLAIGLVVDDAIIVVENVHRHMEEGLTRFEAALQAMRELTIPIIAMTLVLISVYIPIGFMEGLTGILFTEFAFTLAGAVTISAIIALILSPMMCSQLLQKTKDNSINRFNFMKYIDKKFDKLHLWYQNILSEMLQNITFFGYFIAIIFVIIIFLYSTSKSELAPEEDQGVIIAQLTAAPNATLHQTQFYAEQVNQIFHQFKESDGVFELDGSNLTNAINVSLINMRLKPWDQRKKTTSQLAPIIQEKVNKITGAKVAINQPLSLPGNGGLPIQFVVSTTESFEKLNEIIQTLLEKARESGIFLFLDTDLKIDKAQYNIILDRTKTAELGISMQDISDNLSGALSQNFTNYFNLAGKSYQVIPQVTHGARLSIDQVMNYNITANNLSIPLSTIGHVKTSTVAESLNHFQQLNAATLSATPFPGVSLGEALTTLEQLSKTLLPRDYTVDYAGQLRQFVQEKESLAVTFTFAVIIIFLALSALFNSFRDPLIILITVPMSICGALIFISLGVGGISLNIYTDVGLITLIGLISKHGILIVKFANDLQRKGIKKREAIIMAAGIRLRPILMTTAAMVLGVMPLLFTSYAGAVSRFNIGLVIASGMSIGTLFTLFVVPAMYIVFAEDKHNT